MSYDYKSCVCLLRGRWNDSERDAVEWIHHRGTLAQANLQSCMQD
jgi:hypothetical protein